MSESKPWLLFGFILGVIMIIFFEPTTTALGLAIAGGCAYGMGWLS